ncbi:MAG: hypothetical protein ACFFC7_14605 [Candidatus Hermodarchaeota archaeon]
MVITTPKRTLRQKLPGIIAACIVGGGMAVYLGFSSGFICMIFAPTFSPSMDIQVHRMGPEEWLPVVRSVESFLPSIPSSSVEYDYYILYGLETFNFTEHLNPLYYSNKYLRTVYVRYNVTFDVITNSNVSETILDYAFNSSYWRGDEYWEDYWDDYDRNSPYGWIYLTENETSFHYQEILNRSSFQLALDPFIQNFTAGLEAEETILYMLQKGYFSTTGCVGAHGTQMARIILTTTTGHVVLMILIFLGMYIAD